MKDTELEPVHPTISERHGNTILFLPGSQSRKYSTREQSVQ